MIEKNPLTTLFSTSEGLSFLAYMAMVVYGMVTGQVDYLEGLGALGGGSAVWTGMRSYVKKDDPGDVKTLVLEAIDEIRKERANA
jgi:hypothetical protein